MRISNLICAVLLLGVATAHAHVKVEFTRPADKSKVSAPAAIELGLSESAWLAELTLQRNKEPARKLQVPAGEDAVVLAVPLPALAAGTYTVTYRVESQDGHATTGKFSFTVDPSASPAGAATPPAQQDHAHHDGVKAGPGKGSRQ